MARKTDKKDSKRHCRPFRGHKAVFPASSRQGDKKSSSGKSADAVALASALPDWILAPIISKYGYF